MSTLTQTADAPAALSQPWRRDPVAAGLRAIRRRELLYQLLGVLLICACASLSYLIGEMLADRIWEFSSLQRLGLWHTAKWTLVLLGGGLLLLTFVRARNPLYHAREIERALGLRDEVLLTYVDLRRRGAVDETQREVAGLLAAQALTRMKDVDPDRVVDVRVLHYGARVLAGLAAALAVFAFWCGSSFFLTFRRAVMPWQELPVPRETRLGEVRPGTVAIVAGEPVKFECTASGVLPKMARLRYGIVGEPEASANLNHDGNGHYEVELPGFTRPVTYRIFCNDAESPAFHLTPFDRPLITSVQVRVHPPPYAPHAPVREVASGHVQAILDSTLEVVATANQPPASAEALRVNEASAWLEILGSRRPMKADGRVLRGSFRLTQDTYYQLGYLAASGFPSSAGVVYRAQAMPDVAPTAALRREGAAEGAPAAADEVVVLQARAADDLGVRRLTLRCGFEGDAARELDYSPPRPRVSLEVPLSLDLARWRAQAGRMLVCELVAEDVFPVPHRTVSAAVRIPIVASSRPAAKDARPALETQDPFAALVQRLREADAARREKPRPEREPVLDAELRRLREKAEEWVRALKRLQENKPSDPETERKERGELTQAERELVERLAELMDKLAKQENAPDEAAGGKRDDYDEPQGLTDTPEEKKAEEKSGAERREGKGVPAGEGSGDQAPDGKQAGTKEQGKGQDAKAPGSDKENGLSRRPEKGEAGAPVSKVDPNESGGGTGPDGKNSGEERGGGKGAGEGAGAGKGKASDEFSEARDGGAGQGQGQGQEQGPGKGQGQGQGRGPGPRPSVSPGRAGTPGGGGGGGGVGGVGPGDARALDPSAGKAAGNGAGSAEMQALKATREQLEAAAGRMRERGVDDETVRLANAAVANLGAGRTFTDSETRQIREAASKLATAAEAGGPAPTRAEQPAADAAGRAREKLSGGQGAGSGKVEAQPGEQKEDPVSRLIQSGQAKVLPEYRKALEEYYKAVSK